MVRLILPTLLRSEVRANGRIPTHNCLDKCLSNVSVEQGIYLRRCVVGQVLSSRRVSYSPKSWLKARRAGLPWRASSHGLALERNINNVGPMAVEAR
jgi:hypothetical protein